MTKQFTIDDRLPNLDDSLAGLVIAERYRPVATEADYQLLQRVGPYREPTNVLASGEARVGSALRLSGGDFCELTLAPTALGRLVSAGWMTPPMFLDLTRADGTSSSYRFVPSMVSAGFIVPEGAVSITLSNTPTARFCFDGSFRYRLLEIPKS